MAQTKKQDRDRARIEGAVRALPWRQARGWANRSIIRLLSTPRAKKVYRETRNTRSTCRPRPRVVASEMVLDMATGKPAVATISSRL